MKTLWQKICASRNQHDSQSPRALKAQLIESERQLIEVRAQLANARAHLATSKQRLIAKLTEIGVPNAHAIVENSEQLEAVRNDVRNFRERQAHEAAVEIAAAHGLRRIS